MQQMKLFGVFIAVLASMGFVTKTAWAECGVASYYWQGKVTANGERYNPDGISAAHKRLPFGSRVRVTHQRSGKSIDVRINDRGPFIPGRIIDLSRGANRIFGMDGIAPVCITVLSYGDNRYVGNGGARRSRVASRNARSGTRIASRKLRGTRVASRGRGITRVAMRGSRKYTRTASLRRSQRLAALSNRRQRLASLNRKRQRVASVKRYRYSETRASQRVSRESILRAQRDANAGE